jgi:hypothetical protein
MDTDVQANNIIISFIYCMPILLYDIPMVVLLVRHRAYVRIARCVLRRTYQVLAVLGVCRVRCSTGIALRR